MSVFLSIVFVVSLLILGFCIYAIGRLSERKEWLGWWGHELDNDYLNSRTVDSFERNPARQQGRYSNFLDFLFLRQGKEYRKND